ncbi:MAG: LytTR family transcriptional regulator DNA-binding domain-containing protein [Flavobacteriaceae bacterium]|nr:LytTR family transcriptional regulator DNA-binding domain-containing protein [Flavobacteriaceae bacterium]
MSEQITILIVEDEMLIGANISLQLQQLGYAVLGLIPRGEEALELIKSTQPDIILLDINLKGELDGIETAHIMQKSYDIPIIYLTANVDQINFNRAKSTHPYAYISKPYKKLDLQRAIELTVNRLMSERTKSYRVNENAPLVLNDSIFVKDHDNMVKIKIKSILYIEAERNYCRIYTNSREFLLVMTLKEMDEKLPEAHFIRIHRSFIINLSQIDEVGNSHVLIERKVIPLSKSHRDKLLQRLQTI